VKGLLKASTVWRGESWRASTLRQNISGQLLAKIRKEIDDGD
jgi:hypothetical protein